MEAFRKGIIERVRKGAFVAVCSGVTVDILVEGGWYRRRDDQQQQQQQDGGNLVAISAEDLSGVPGVNMVPRGPHPTGSFEVRPFEHEGALREWQKNNLT